MRAGLGAPVLVAAACLAVLLAAPGDAADTGCPRLPAQKWPLMNKTGLAPPKYVFRGDGRDWQTIRSEGGWLPHAIDHISPKAFGVYNHEKDIRFAGGKRDSIYVSTTLKFDVAARYALLHGKDTWVYFIHAAPNMVDMNRSLGNESRFWWQGECPALGGIHFSQIVGWVRIDQQFRDEHKAYAVPACGQEDYANRFFQGLELSRNDAYEPARWDEYSARGRWYETVEPCAHFLNPSANKTTEQYALEFMDATKEATGWRGHWPLFDPPPK